MTSGNGANTEIRMPSKEAFSRPIRSAYPVVIIGAGINGCGLFRELSLQGVDCLLIDRGDYCSGASAAPSRLIHGGIKYLETGEFRLVRESALERNLLLHNAPHYVKPLETVLPIRSVWGGIGASVLRFLRLPSKLNDRGEVITRIGLSLYDLYGRSFQSMPNHRMLTGSALKRELPDLHPFFRSVGIYYEARITHAERLGLELVRDALCANPANAAKNYCSVIGLHEDGRLLLGAHSTGETYAVEADIVVNAAGAWIDKVNAAMGIRSSYMGGHKGTHLVVRNRRLLEALRGRMVYFGSRDGRVNLLYPFMGNVLIGSTDIPIEDPDDALCDEEEVHYLMNVVGEVFPDIPLSRNEIIFAYWGVRPLPRTDKLDLGAVSRDHRLAEDKLPGSNAPVLSMIGGKWTTFRGFSQKTADHLLGFLGIERKCSTEKVAIGGGTGFPFDAGSRHAVLADMAHQAGISEARAATLLDRYGTYAWEVLRSLDIRSDLALRSLPGYSRGEITFLCRTEAIHRLSDLIFRRTGIALSGDLSTAAIEEIAEIAATALDWSEAAIKYQIAEMKREAALHCVPPAQGSL